MKTRQLTIGYIFNKEKQIPAIRLSGDWLAKNGFQIGRKISVSEKTGEIRIQLNLDDDRQGSLNIDRI